MTVKPKTAAEIAANKARFDAAQERGLRARAVARWTVIAEAAPLPKGATWDACINRDSVFLVNDDVYAGHVYELKADGGLFLIDTDGDSDHIRSQSWAGFQITVEALDTLTTL